MARPISTRGSVRDGQRRRRPDQQLEQENRKLWRANAVAKGAGFHRRRRSTAHRSDSGVLCNWLLRSQVSWERVSGNDRRRLLPAAKSHSLRDTLLFQGTMALALVVEVAVTHARRTARSGFVRVRLLARRRTPMSRAYNRFLWAEPANLAACGNRSQRSSHNRTTRETGIPTTPVFLTCLLRQRSKSTSRRPNLSWILGTDQAPRRRWQPPRVSLQVASRSTLRSQSSPEAD